MKRCLILGCSQTKTDFEGDISALDRYDGPAFRVVRKYLNSAVTSEHPDIYILSAKFGLITAAKPIPNYDQRMTTARARELNTHVLRALQSDIVPKGYCEIFLSMGKTYLEAISNHEAILRNSKITFAEGGTGDKLSALKKWLYGTQTSLFDNVSLENTKPAVIQPKAGGRPVVLKGKTLSFTAEQVYQIARLALETNDKRSTQNYKNWYILIDDVRVAPKWLVNQLSGIPVSAFDASAARRVLTGLGIPIHRNIDH